MKPKLKFKQMPDQLSRFQIIESDIPSMRKGEAVLDPYPYFYREDRYAVWIYLLNGKIFKNKEAVNYDREASGS